MKTVWMKTAAAIAVAALVSGCGGGSSYTEGYEDGYVDGFYDGARYPELGMTTLFLRDIQGFALAGIHYQCLSPDGTVTADYITAPNGEFSFYPGERCEFDFYGFEGTPLEPIFIEDDIGEGKGDIFYECMSGTAGTTTPDGSFEYEYNDMCTFSF